MEEDRANKLKIVRENIGTYPDFPKPGIIFRDIFSVLKNPIAYNCLSELLIEEALKLGKIDVVVGLESRGFLFGLSLAKSVGAAFVPIRKKGKLPGQLVQITYELEYGTDTFEIQKDSIKKGQKVLIIDDLLATGGTLSASCGLINQLEAQVVQCLVIIELVELNGKKKIKVPVNALLQF